MHFLSLIEAKRDGAALTEADIRALVFAFSENAIPDYQMAAFLMAVYFQGMTVEETTAMTAAMRDSGAVLAFPKDNRPLVDKHSTGGVGDKASLPLAPLLACLGFRVPMISGRGLGITGGTLDKLESIPGFQTALPTERIIRQVQEIGCVICGQTDTLAPADRRMYALRDVTGTVPSMPLITASILSKKLAESLQALILDVKVGSAATTGTPDQAALLAERLTALGSACGVNTRAILTDMNTPLGRSAGNRLEIRETVDCLHGHGPADLRELVITLAAHLLLQTGRADALETGMEEAERCLDSGEPRKLWDTMLEAQGTDLEAFYQDPMRDTTAGCVREWNADRSGFVTRCDARIIGEVVRDLGAGRMRQEDAVDPAVGVDRLMKPGEAVCQGDLLVRVHARSDGDAETALVRLKEAFWIEATPPPRIPLIHAIVKPPA